MRNMYESNYESMIIYDGIALKRNFEAMYYEGLF